MWFFQLHNANSHNIKARVLGVENYDYSAGADISPTDLALGWGIMSDTKIIKQLNINQGNRFYYYYYKNQPPIEPKEIIKNSANTHIVPINKQIEKRIKKIRVGQVIYLSGYLINITKENGWHWNSSLTREDSGDGACELMLVETVDIIN